MAPGASASAGKVTLAGSPERRPRAREPGTGRAALRPVPALPPARGRAGRGSALRCRSSSWRDLSLLLAPPPLPASAPASSEPGLLGLVFSFGV